MYKKDCENERSHRERMINEVAKVKLTKSVKQEQHEDRMKQIQLESLQEAYAIAVEKVSDLDKELLELKQTLQTKEETWKRSLEEARASSSKLNEEVMLLTQQVKQYKKLADNLRSQVEKYEQMNMSQVQQVLQNIIKRHYVRGIMKQ